MAERAPVAYRLLDHTADIGFAVEAPELPALFGRAALALHDVIADTAAARPAVEREVEAEGSDLADALVRFLEEALFLFEGERFLLAEVGPVEIGAAAPVRVRARVRGERFDPSRHELRRPIKAITYHDVEVARKNGGWSASVIVDL
jgi:SHS2 domain-containing protein